ncbi:hypothetical protein SARC_02089 [Sphaeroforma arctica JP610]|uniref:UDP-N-acetylglucosamine transferase subunit ALG13 n=1 Tax=Sphaeroforma arctica JP610 TaxID=667725 RepID=A0A0L0G9S2_9EUKA|nr:hypothetical protein SARC_02089 [Sphaeroforma arctica JP610]KNC85750.1 hypothetical protein SARC_02089 [Sphaeroforma arctica JP610]|eukprot:XP_014159652.1 hypothetical protein SARC_02089 [Sphaeroforma arctica JP610]
MLGCARRDCTDNMSAESAYAFVTVGSTEFDKLIDAVLADEVLLELKRRGIQRLLLQIGRGSEDSVRECCAANNTAIPITYYRFKSSLLEDISSADLVISHAGSGTILESLGAKRKLVVIVNEDLMDNHQIELAQQLKAMGHIAFGTSRTLPSLLEDDQTWGHLLDYPDRDPSIFANYVNKQLGFE